MSDRHRPGVAADGPAPYAVPPVTRHPPGTAAPPELASRTSLPAGASPQPARPLFPAGLLHGWRSAQPARSTPTSSRLRAGESPGRMATHQLPPLPKADPILMRPRLSRRLSYGIAANNGCSRPGEYPAGVTGINQAAGITGRHSTGGYPSAAILRGYGTLPRGAYPQPMLPDNRCRTANRWLPSTRCLTGRRSGCLPGRRARASPPPSPAPAFLPRRPITFTAPARYGLT